MGAERDAAGSPGAGVSTGGTRDSAGLEAGTTRSLAEDTRTGGAEVHGGLHAGGGLGGSTGAMGDVSGSGALGTTGTLGASGTSGATGTEYGALGFSRTAGTEGVAERATNRLGGMVDDVRGRAQDLGGRAQELAGQARERVTEAAGQARERLDGAVVRTQTFLDDQGVTERIRQNPMPALGIAFGLGYLLAGSSEHKGVVGKARGELRHAILGGVTAVVMREARGYLGNIAGGGTLGSFLGGSQGGSTAGMATHRPPSHREQL
jgi:ElaB/YqjD/DUF883 family membrane-anchored ribosome-binding protein